MSLFAGSMAITSVAFLVAGIAWPQTAETLLRMLLATLALGFVVARAFRAGLPERTTRDAYSPFDGYRGAPTTSAAPQGIRELIGELSAADDPRLARRTAIPWTVGRAVVVEASRRLVEHHGLRLGEPNHHLAIRSLVSEPTWLLISPRDLEPGAGTRLAGGGGTVPLSQLTLILDDLEGL